MWLKTLGLLCAGVFVGAALIEAKQLLRDRKKNKTKGKKTTSGPDDGDEDQSDSPAAVEAKRE